MPWIYNFAIITQLTRNYERSRLTPFEKLKEYYNQNNNIEDINKQIQFSKSLQEFINYENQLMNKYSLGLDN